MTHRIADVEKSSRSSPQKLGDEVIPADVVSCAATNAFFFD
jgi:hypothetical protein